MHTYQVNTQASVPIQWLALAVLLSILIHMAILFFIPITTNHAKKIKPTVVSISIGQQNQAQEARTVNSQEVQSVRLSKSQTPVTSPLTTSPVLPSIPEVLSAPLIAAEGLKVAKEISLLPEPITPELTELADIIPALDIQSLLPESISSEAIQSTSLASPEVVFKEIQLPDLVEITAIDPLELIPEINEQSALDGLTDIKEINFLAGLTPQYQSKITQQLSTGLNDLKSIVEQLKLEGSLRFQFMIDRQGRLVQSAISQSSNNVKLDQLVLDMLKKHSPYSPLPKAYLGNYLRFSYPISIRLK